MRRPRTGVVYYRSVADDYLIPPDTGIPPTEVVNTQSVADCLSLLVRIPSDGTEHGVGMPVTNIPSSCIKRKVSSVCKWYQEQEPDQPEY